MVKIGKEYHWEMSHRLPFHKGGCYNIHGHSYKLMLELAGTTDENGMLLDYYEMDKTVYPILNEYDHALVLDNSDDKVIALIDELKFKYKIIDVTSTSENLAAHFIGRFKQQFSEYKNIKTITVRVYETYDAFAEVTEEMN